MESRTTKAGELAEEVPISKTRLLYRNRTQVWPGVYATGCLWVGEGKPVTLYDRGGLNRRDLPNPRTELKGVLYVRDTTFEPGAVFEFLETVCRELGMQMQTFDSDTYEGFVLYSADLVAMPRFSGATIHLKDAIFDGDALLRAMRSAETAEKDA